MQPAPPPPAASHAVSRRPGLPLPAHPPGSCQPAQNQATSFPHAIIMSARKRESSAVGFWPHRCQVSTHRRRRCSAPASAGRLSSSQ